MADLQKILLITNDSALEKHIRKLSTVVSAKQISTAIKMLEKYREDCDLVVLGPPYGDKEKQQIDHPNIFVIKHPQDVAALFNLYKPQQGLQTARPQEGQRKIRPLKTDINYAAAGGTVLLITTNRSIIQELSCFDLKVATNLYSAQRLLGSNEIDLIVTDMETKPKTNLPTYKWGVDILTKKDVYLLLTTGRLSLETIATE